MGSSHGARRGGRVPWMTGALAASALAASAYLASAYLASAQPASFYDAYIAPGGTTPCYARAYDAAHLAANPRQRLTGFTLRLSQLAPRPAAGAEEFDVTIGFTLKGADDRYRAEATCSPAAPGAHCLVEGDGGDFTLSGDDRGLLLRVGERLEIEGARSFSPDLARDGDDTLVRLFPLGPALCRFD